MKKSILLFIAVTFLCTCLLPAQEDPAQIYLEDIFKHKEYTADSFGKVQWLHKGQSYTPVDRTKYKSRDIDEFVTESGERKILVPEEQLVPEGADEALEVYSYKWSQDKRFLLIFTNTRKVWRYHTRGDYWIYDKSEKKLWQIGQGLEAAKLMFADISPDSRKVAYIYKHNIYLEDLYSRKRIQLTFDGSEHIINGTFDWVYEEEFKLRKGFRWSPDSKKIAFWQLDTKGIGIFNMINNTDAIYPKLIPIEYPKVGTTNPSCKIGVINLVDKSITFLELEGNTREHYIAWMEWIPETQSILFQRLNRRQNTIWLTEWDINSGQTSVRHVEKEETWLDVVKDLKWVNNNKQFIWLSERDGWRHLYMINRDGSGMTNVSPGDFDIIDLKYSDSESGDYYFIASPQNAGQRYLYRGNMYKKSIPELITPEDEKGTHEYDISPDGKYAIHTYSNFNRPPRTQLVALPDHNVIRVMVNNDDLQHKLNALKLGKTEFFQIQISNGLNLDGWAIFPPDFNPAKKYPVLFYVYGEPGSQTVRDHWRRSRSVWHRMLSQKGYIIMSVDNRGTPAPRGRDWRKIVYGQIGLLASEDQANALEALLVERPYMDAERIAIWGWSGGGTMSLNMIFRFPDLYHTAMAVAPVADQRLYDTIYQERYMGLLSDNEHRYIDGSPITYAHQLEGNLLLVHGTGDDNVHYQNSEVLANELIKHNKQFSMMAYPNRSHSIREGENTSLHLYTLLTQYLLSKMPPDNHND